MSQYAGAVLGQLDRVFNRGTVAGQSEGGLLARFLACSDEAAFAAIVERHGPMVLGVCRRVLRDEHDVEDAFQATFLVLVRRARSIRDGDLLGPWLRGVARRVAVRARANAAKRQARETTRPDDVAAAPSGCHYLRALLDEELARLPARMRDPLILCYLDGLTHDEAASRLRWPVGTVRSRMARGRDLLRRRLSRRGVTADDAVLAAVLAPSKVPTAWVEPTVRASFQFLHHKSAAVAVSAGTSAALARGVIDAMTIAKLKVLGMAAAACLVTLGGVKSFAQFGGSAGKDLGDSPPAEKKAGNPPSEVVRELEKVQNGLRSSGQQIAALEREVQALRAELARFMATPAAEPGDQTRSGKPERGNLLLGSGGSVRQSDGAAPENPKGPRPPTHYQIGQNKILVVSPEGDRAGVYDLVSGEAERVRLADDKTKKHEVNYVNAPGIVALALKGPGVSRLAVYVERGGMSAPMGGSLMGSPAMMMGMMSPASPGGRNNRQPLTPPNPDGGPAGEAMMGSMMGMGPKPVGGWFPYELREPADAVTPIVSPGTAVYVVGRRVYAFSILAGAWAVLELPEGVKPTPSVGPNGQIRCANDGHIYTFDNATRQWKDFDTRSILAVPDPEGELPPDR